MRFTPCSKTLLAVGLAALALAGCGRRGSLEPPGASTSSTEAGGSPSKKTQASARGLPRSVSTASANAAIDPDAVRDGEELSPVAVPPGTDAAGPVQTDRGAKRGYVVPKQPFILDPIL